MAGHKKQGKIYRQVRLENGQLFCERVCVCVCRTFQKKRGTEAIGVSKSNGCHEGLILWGAPTFAFEKENECSYFVVLRNAVFLLICWTSDPLPFMMSRACVKSYRRKLGQERQQEDHPLYFLQFPRRRPVSTIWTRLGKSPGWECSARGCKKIFGPDSRVLRNLDL